MIVANDLEAVCLIICFYTKLEVDVIDKKKKMFIYNTFSVVIILTIPFEIILLFISVNTLLMCKIFMQYYTEILILYLLF